jgi:large subunit ribosomal protein L19
MDIIQAVEKDIAPVERTVNFNVGDTVSVHYKIIEGNRERIQVFEGIVIAIDNKGLSKNFPYVKYHSMSEWKGYSPVSPA